MNVSIWSIRNPIPVVLLFILMTAAGLMAFSGLKVQSLPDIDVPVITITASLPGASPSLMETEVARKIENALASVPGVKHLESRLTDGQADISVEFQLEKPTQEALDDVRDAISRVRGDLPANLRDPVVRKAMVADSPILTYTVASEQTDDQALSWFVDNDVSRALLAVPGVGSVTRVGGVSREVHVDLDPDQLLALRTTAADISHQLRQMQQEDSGGRMDLGGSEQSVRTIATVATAEELSAVELTLPDGRKIRLDEIAAVRDTWAEPRSAALLDGAPVVGFEVTRAKGAGELNVAAGVRRALADLELRHASIRITEAFNQVDQVVENYRDSMRLLYEGAALAVLVVWLFLRDWRATLVAAVALPLSVIPTFALMHAMGFTLNIVTLLSLSLVVGALVDDAIVEIENIERHLRMGKSPLQASSDAATEIGLAVVATTFTLMAVFLPTAFMHGTVGKFFVQFGWTSAGAVFFSLMVARMLTPMMAAGLLRPPTSQRAHRPAWMGAYLVLVRCCLRHRARTLMATALLTAGGVSLVPLLPSTFVPPNDDAQTQVTLTLAPGSTLVDTVAIAEQAREVIAQLPHVRMVYTAIGGGSSGGGSPDAASTSAASVQSAVLTLNLTPRAEREGVRQQFIEEQLIDALSVLPGIQVRVGLGGSSENYVLALAGDDNRALEAHALTVMRELRAIPGIGSVASSASLVRPELRVIPDFARAADLGVSSASIAQTLRVATVGDSQQALATLNLSQRQIPIVVRLNATARQNLETLKRLPVPGARGPVPLENVAAIEFGSGPAQITRLDRRRNINIEIQTKGRPLSEIEQVVTALPSLSRPPRGLSHGVLGDAEDMDELAGGFLMAMLTGVLCVYLVLVLLLKDVVQPVTILTALALSVPGAVLALFLSGFALSMPSMIGLIMLMGIVTKNSILLVDYIIIARRDHGLRRSAAILDACQKRALPIVMTTIAMVAGMLPIALGWSGDPSFRAPMAIVVVGGLTTSTVLSLLVIPVVYCQVDDGVRWIRRRLGAPIRPVTRGST